MTAADFTQIPSNVLKTNIFNERYIYSVNRNSFSKVSANVIFDAEYKQKVFKENSLFIFIGTDSGLLPNYIQQQGVPIGTRYLFIETEQVLSELHQYQLLNELDTSIICTSYDEWEQEAKKLKIEQYSYINAISLISAICAQQNSSEEYAELNWHVGESLQTIHWKHSVQLSTEAFISRQIENIADLQLPAKILENAYQGQTVIILAGGPSLHDILPWVKENRQNLVVFSVSRISKHLINANITPDFVFSVDPHKISFGVSHEMLSFGNQPILIHSHHIYPALLNQWEGSNLYLGQRLPWKSPLNIKNLNSAGPTVTNSALITAYHFGFDQILLAGVDLCYAKNGITHTQGSAEQLAGPKYNTTSLQVETYDGEQRETGEDFFVALQALTHQAEYITKDNRTIINLAKNAAKTEGIIYLSKEELDLKPLIINALAIADTKISSNITSTQSEYYQQVVTELEKADYHINVIEKLAKKANKINANMYNSHGIIENYKDKKKLDKTEKILNSKHRTHSKLVKNFGVRQFLKITTPHNDEKEWEAEQAQELGKIYYDAYQSGTQKISILIKKAIASTKTRQEEKKENPDFQILFNSWNNNYAYKRAAIWKNDHPNILLTDKISKEFALFENKFTDFVRQAESELISSIEKGRSDIYCFKNKAKILFNNKRLAELKDLKDKFQTDIKNKDKQDYLYLTFAYIEELEKNYGVALDFLDNIINTENTDLLEEALTRVTSISIEQQNHQNASLALQCLTQISPIYLPFYAESARILDDLGLAVDSYITYINFFPEDIVVQLKLASLYLSHGINDAAELVIEHILKSTPDLETALTMKKQLQAMKKDGVVEI